MHNGGEHAAAAIAAPRKSLRCIVRVLEGIGESVRGESGTSTTILMPG